MFLNIGYKDVSIPHINSSKKTSIPNDDRKILEFYNSYDLKLFHFLRKNNYLKN